MIKKLNITKKIKLIITIITILEDIKIMIL